MSQEVSNFLCILSSTVSKLNAAHGIKLASLYQSVLIVILYRNQTRDPCIVRQFTTESISYEWSITLTITHVSNNTGKREREERERQTDRQIRDFLMFYKESDRKHRCFLICL